MVRGGCREGARCGREIGTPAVSGSWVECFCGVFLLRSIWGANLGMGMGATSWEVILSTNFHYTYRMLVPN